jgi:hypothetical protein
MSQHKRNVQGLRDAMKAKRESAIERTNKALELIQNQTPITFTELARLAGVSKAWIYREESICQRLRDLKLHKPNPFKEKPRREENNLVANLKKRIKLLEADNAEFKKQLEIVYGELYLKTKNITKNIV